jgi:hypothetical protein
MALHIVGYSCDSSQLRWNPIQDPVLQLREYVLRRSRGWNPHWQDAVSNSHNTLVWRLWQGQNATPARYSAKFTVTNGGVESTLEIPYLPSHVEEYSQQGLTFHKLVIIDPDKDRGPGLEGCLIDMDDLVNHHAPGINTIVVSQSTAKLQDLNDWLRGRISHGFDMQLRTYSDDVIF